MAEEERAKKRIEKLQLNVVLELFLLLVLMLVMHPYP
jgi:hypothetical protein